MPSSTGQPPLILFVAFPRMGLLDLAMHTKGDAQGVKKPRPGLRVVPLSTFTSVDSIPALYATLFGPPNNEKAPAMQGLADEDEE